MAPDDDGEPLIAYTVRELLSNMDRKLDSVVAGLGLKADHADLAATMSRITGAEERIARLESRDADREKRRRGMGEWWKWAIPALFAAIAAAGVLISALARHG